VNVDVSTYDRSCSSDLDCISIWGGVTCPGGCLCAANAAVNVDELARYERTLAPLPPIACNCPVVQAPNAVCVNGLCTYVGPPTTPPFYNQ